MRQAQQEDRRDKVAAMRQRHRRKHHRHRPSQRSNECKPRIFAGFTVINPNKYGTDRTKQMLDNELVSIIWEIDLFSMNGLRIKWAFQSKYSPSI